jgi:hypothetical protein
MNLLKFPSSVNVTKHERHFEKRALIDRALDLLASSDNKDLLLGIGILMNRARFNIQYLGDYGECNKRILFQSIKLINNILAEIGADDFNVKDKENISAIKEILEYLRIKRDYEKLKDIALNCEDIEIKKHAVWCIARIMDTNSEKIILDIRDNCKNEYIRLVCNEALSKFYAHD